MAELSEACEKEGLGLFLYYSYAADWKHLWFYSREAGWENARPAYKVQTLIRNLSPHALISFKQGANGDEDFVAPERGGGARVGQQYPVAERAYEPLAFANIGIPGWYDSKDLFDKGFKREFIVSNKDRMDWNIDRVRALTTDDGYRYIRNYLLDRPYTQLNYRSGEALFKNMEELFAKGELSEVQARFFLENNSENTILSSIICL